MGTKAVMTVEEFAGIKTADTEDYELVEGELIPLSSGTLLHAKVRRRIERMLEDYFAKHPIGEPFGEIDCRLSSDTVRRPDVSVFLGELVQQLNLNTIPAPFPPDIAVEVLSPSESAIDVRRKVRDYLRAGTKEVWLLDHANGEVMVHTSTGIRVVQGTETLESPLLPGFSAAVNELVATNVR